MNNALVIGPVAVPYTTLLVPFAVAPAWWVARSVDRKRGSGVEAILWRALLVGLVFARLGFVAKFPRAFLGAPLTILDLRDGGWNAVVGFIAAWLYALSKSVDKPTQRRPLIASISIGSATWFAGLITLAVFAPAGQPMPSLQLASLDGTSVDLRGFIGKPTVVNLWASWCPPCVREMPVLQRAQSRSPGVNFVFVDEGETSQRAIAWLADRQLTLRNVLVDSALRAGAAFGEKAYPTTLFFDARGILVSTRVGELSQATLSQRLEKITR